MHFHASFLIVTLLFQFSSSQVCTDDWHLVHTADGLVCWALLSVPDFATDYAGSLNLCESAKATGVEVKNAAEKATLADLASRVAEPTLSCYKASKSTVNGQFKAFDYEKPPEYLVKLNQEGRVKLKRRIEKEDRISIGFSMRLAEPGSGSTSRLLEAKFQIGNSSHFSIELKCRHDDQLNTKICKVRHSGTHHAQARTIQLTEKKIRDLFSVQFFGVLHFDFLDKRIAFLDQELDLPDKFTYIGQDEIRVGNILVTSVEHSKVCQGLDMYAFETRDLSKPMPDWHEQPEHLPALRENYGTKASFPIPTNFFYDFYYPMREDGSNSDGLDNRIIFDIRVSGQTFRDIKLNFTSEARKKTVIAVQLDSGANKIRLFGYEPDDDWIGKEESHFYSSVGHNLKNFRVSISSAPDFLLAEATVSARGETIFTTKRTMKHRVIDNVRLRSDTAIFYDVQMTSLSDVVVTTCNFRPFKLEDLEDRVPYHSECYKERNILCQKPPQDIKEEAQIPDELKEEFVWTESFVNTNVTVIPLPLKVAVPVDEDDVIVEDIEPFQWCIVGITAASTTMFITIVALNCIRGGL